jgi:hypothetical protein
MADNSAMKFTDADLGVLPLAIQRSERIGQVTLHVASPYAAIGERLSGGTKECALAQHAKTAPISVRMVRGR